jgi:hypothetical protein
MEVLKGLTHAISVITLEYHHDEKDVRKTVECVDYLSRLGELSLNVTLGDEPGFHWPHWIDYNSFRDFFPSQAPRTPTCGWVTYSFVFNFQTLDILVIRLGWVWIAQPRAFALVSRVHPHDFVFLVRSRKQRSCQMFRQCGQ